MYLVIVGNPLKGDDTKFYGPFVGYDSADQWVNTNHPDEYTAILPLEQP